MARLELATGEYNQLRPNSHTTTTTTTTTAAAAAAAVTACLFETGNLVFLYVRLRA